MDSSLCFGSIPGLHGAILGTFGHGRVPMWQYAYTLTSEGTACMAPLQVHHRKSGLNNLLLSHNHDGA